MEIISVVNHLQGILEYMSSFGKSVYTELGLYVVKRSVNRAEVSRKTAITTYHLSHLSINPKAQLRLYELYLIAITLCLHIGYVHFPNCESV